jgi:diguanylate cyclase (GGDEF)-like protein
MFNLEGFVMGIVNNFLTSGHSFSEDEYELKTKFVLLNGMLLATFLAITVLTFLQWRTANVVSINFLYIIMSVTAFFFLRKDKKYLLLAFYVMLFISIVVLVVWLMVSPEVFIRSLWFLILLTFAFLIGGTKAGYSVSIVGIITIAIIYWDNELDVHILYLIIIFLVLLTLLIGIYEHREVVIKHQLSVLNDSLEERVREKTSSLLQQKNAYQELAYYDTLTKLPNRVHFFERLKHSIRKSKRNKVSLAVLFIDLDNFKSINDLHGHYFGDEVLKIIASRLKKHSRESDTLARLGGDEFTLILEDIKDVSMVGIVAQNLKQAVTVPINLQGHELHITVSIGISLYPKDSEDADELTKHADTAMYSAKKDGRNLFHFYKSSMTDALLNYLTMETYIRRGLENDEFIVYYQPQIDARTSKLVGLEALVRWKHPQRGIVPPSEFIPVAESSSLIIPLGERVLSCVVKDMQHWHGIGFDPGTVSVNLSVKQLSDKHLISRIKKALKTIDFRQKWLELEITESFTFQNPKQAIGLLKKIRSLGVLLAIDDFGTGFSSLSYLKKLPVTKLKIDQSFVKEIPRKAEDAILVRSILSMVENFKLDVIAEGVETKEQMDFLLQEGCNKMQGYFFGRPISADEIEKLFLH